LPRSLDKFRDARERAERKSLAITRFFREMLALFRHDSARKGSREGRATTLKPKISHVREVARRSSLSRLHRQFVQVHPAQRQDTLLFDPLPSSCRRARGAVRHRVASMALHSRPTRQVNRCHYSLYMRAHSDNLPYTHTWSGNVHRYEIHVRTRLRDSRL